MKKVAFYTLGCKVNQYETEAMIETFEKKGYENVSSEEYADVYVINTCTVTHMSDRKSRQYIRRIKKINPNARVAVVGCYSQVSPEEILDIEGVNLVMGTQDRIKIADYIDTLTHEDKVSTVDDIMKVREFEKIEISQTNGRTRAFIKIQDGCDRYCSYCIIPYARGRVRSRDLQDIIDEITSLSSIGFKEVVLTGIHVASYGKDLKDERVGLLDVLKAVNEIEDVKRIRLSSVEPVLFTDEFIEKLKEIDKLAPHFHLSLQSGSDGVLKRMNRRYTTSEYEKAVEKIRENFPHVALTTDVIVGFPGETDIEFMETVSFLRRIRLTDMHVFKYSPRKGTPAAKMETQVSPQVKQMRSDTLLKIARENKVKFLDDMIGLEFDVLFEEEVDNMYVGHSGNYIKVAVKSEEDLLNKIRSVRIEKRQEDFLIGNLVID